MAKHFPLHLAGLLPSGCFSGKTLLHHNWVMWEFLIKELTKTEHLIFGNG